MQTTYITQPFGYEVRKGKITTKLVTEQPFQFKTESEAVNKAERLAEKKAGVVVVAQQYDPESGDLGEFKVIAQYGDIPEGMFE